MIIILVNQGVQYAKGGVSVVENGLVIPQSKKLIIKTLPYQSDNDKRMRQYNYHGKFWLNGENDSVRLSIQPNVRIKYSQDTTAMITIRKSARGVKFQDARENAEQIGYSYTLQDSILVLDPAIELSQRKRFHAQEVEVTISIPAGTVVFLDPTLKHLLYAIENSEDTWSQDMVGEEWLMTPDGLTRVLKADIPVKKE
jgi:hypothetical protein